MKQQQLLFPGMQSPQERLLASLGQVPHLAIDEAGRGCLAGPVVAAAVLFPAGFDFAAHLPGVADSKELSAAKREKLAPKIMELCQSFGLGYASAGEVDRINILNATFVAMGRACAALLQRLGPVPGSVLPLVIDGNKTIPQKYWQEKYPFPEQHSVVDGDALVPGVSAASILAKTARDSFMLKMDKKYAGYAFAKHKGYGTKAHVEALGILGPCPIHRLTFAKVTT